MQPRAPGEAVPEADEQPAISLPAEACYPELRLRHALPACPAARRCGAKDAQSGRHTRCQLSRAHRGEAMGALTLGRLHVHAGVARLPSTPAALAMAPRRSKQSHRCHQRRERAALVVAASRSGSVGEDRGKRESPPQHPRCVLPGVTPPHPSPPEEIAQRRGQVFVCKPFSSL